MMITPTMTTSKSESSTNNDNIDHHDDTKKSNILKITSVEEELIANLPISKPKSCFHRLLINKVLPSPTTTSVNDISRAKNNFNDNNNNSSSSNKEIEITKSDDTFDDIFLFNKPIVFFRMIEFQIMFTCLYMSLWSTNFITIVKENTSLTITEKWLSHLIMLIPIIISFNRVAYIAETYSLITSISDLNISAVYDALILNEQIYKISDEVRKKFQDKIKIWSGSMHPDKYQQAEFMKVLFLEIDLDGSGSVDHSEFRVLLKKLNLTFSDFRFQLLCRALSTICSCDNSINEAELSEFIFPGIKLPTNNEVRRHSLSLLQINLPLLLNNNNNYNVCDDNNNSSDSSDSSDEENDNNHDIPIDDDNANNNNDNNKKDDYNFPTEGDINFILNKNDDNNSDNNNDNCGNDINDHNIDGKRKKSISYIDNSKEMYNLQSNNDVVIVDDKNGDNKNNKVVVDDKNGDNKNNKVVAGDKNVDDNNNKIVVDDKNVDDNNSKIVVDDKNVDNNDDNDVYDDVTISDVSSLHD